MRLRILHEGHTPHQEAVLARLTAFIGVRPGTVSTLSYRRALFGARFARCLQVALREARAWSVFELEVMVAFVARLHECQH